MQQYQKVEVRAFGRCLSCLANHECEAVHFMCLLLYGAGISKSYSMGNKPSVIEAVSLGFHAKFNCWYIKSKSIPVQISFQLECFYVQQVNTM